MIILLLKIKPPKYQYLYFGKKMTLFSYKFEFLLPKDTICLVKIVLVGHERIFESFQSIFLLCR